MACYKQSNTITYHVFCLPIPELTKNREEANTGVYIKYDISAYTAQHHIYYHHHHDRHPCVYEVIPAVEAKAAAAVAGVGVRLL